MLETYTEELKSIPAMNSVKRILVVDDEDRILYVFREYLKMLGYGVDCAGEMEEAEALLAFSSYALAILDLRLRGQSTAEGLELIRYISEKCPEMRLVILTGSGSPEIEREARRRGADAYLRKPKPLAEVAQVIHDLLEVEV